MDLKIFTNNIEQKALDQINLLLEQEVFKDCKIRIMPDVHAGAGCVIGFTGNLGDKVIPNIVGVDIGCGMLCVELGKIDIDLAALDDFIKNNIPSGYNIYKNSEYKEDSTMIINELYCKDKLRNKEHLLNSLGTLGGGNHFIEIDKDDEDNKYLVIHTGSRNLGKQVAEIYQNIAIKHCSYEEEQNKEINKLINDYKTTNRHREISQGIKDIRAKYEGLSKLPKDLCYLEDKLKDDYLHDMVLCQLFASNNRLKIALKILNYLYNSPRYLYDMNENTLEFIVNYITRNNNGYFETIHNYISFKDNIVRKGAISARKDEKVLIPINMRDGCIIGIGKGNEDWNCSAPHGAGRIMSRNEAKETLKVDDFQNEMKGIYTTTANEATLDEAPMAYKSMQEIIDNIKDTVAIVKIIKPIYNFKASE